MNIFERLIGTGWAELVVPIAPIDCKVSPRVHGKFELGKQPGCPWEDGLWGPLRWKVWNASDGDGDQRMRTWAQWAPLPNVGLRTGLLVAIDIDCEDQRLVDALAGLCLELLGDAPVRWRENSPRCLLLYRTATPMAKQTVTWATGRIEILGQGQQFVAWGTHPSGAELRWHHGGLDGWIAPAIENLTPVDVGELQNAIEAIRVLLGREGLELIREAPRATGDKSRHQVGDPDAMAPEELIAAAVEALPCSWDTAPTREAWVKIVGAIYMASGGTGWGQALAEQWAARWEATPAWEVNDSTWNSFTDGTWWTAAELLELAVRFGWQGGDAYQAWRAERAAADFAKTPPPDEVLTEGLSTSAQEASENSRWSDQAIAHRVVDRVRPALAYTMGGNRQGLWLVYDRGCWRVGEAGAGLLISDTLIRMATGLVAGGDDKIAKKVARSLQSRALRNSVMELARDRLNVGPLSGFDADPYLLNTPDGVIDLKTREQHPHDPVLLMMRQTNVSPAEGWPQAWLEFLDGMFCGDQAMIGWDQKLCGAALIGERLDASIQFFYGLGRNGKTTHMDVLQAVLGNYAVNLPVGALIVRNHAMHPEVLARLAGARLVISSEPPPGAVWDVSLLKHLTGNDKIVARHMYGSSFDFVPRFQLMIQGNHKPQIVVTDQALATRLNMLELRRSFLRPGEAGDFGSNDIRPAIERLSDRIVAACAPQILAWMIEGARRVIADGGLAPRPAGVVDATRRYMAEGNPMRRWGHERLVRGPGMLMSELMADYVGWLKATGDELTIVTHRGFNKAFREVFGDDVVMHTDKGAVAKGWRVMRDLFRDKPSEPSA